MYGEWASLTIHNLIKTMISNWWCFVILWCMTLKLGPLITNFGLLFPVVCFVFVSSFSRSCPIHDNHVIKVCLPSQSVPKSTKIKKKKPTSLCTLHEFLKQGCWPYMQSCYFDYRINKPFTCSHCLIWVSCSVHLISVYCVCKGTWAFYPQINEVRKPDNKERSIANNVQLGMGEEIFWPNLPTIRGMCFSIGL